MFSLKSHENVIQGHLVTFGPGVKNQMDQKNCMSLAPETLYGKGQYGNTTKTGMVEGFSKLTL